MGVLFDYTQAEEAEPEMSCFGWFLTEAVAVGPHARTSQNWLFMKLVYVRLTLSHSCTTLIYTVFVYWYARAVSPGGLAILVGNIYQIV